MKNYRIKPLNTSALNSVNLQCVVPHLIDHPKVKSPKKWMLVHRKNPNKTTLANYNLPLDATLWEYIGEETKKPDNLDFKVMPNSILPYLSLSHSTLSDTNIKFNTVDIMREGVCLGVGYGSVDEKGHNQFVLSLTSNVRVSFKRYCVFRYDLLRDNFFVQIEFRIKGEEEVNTFHVWVPIPELMPFEPDLPENEIGYYERLLLKQFQAWDTMGVYDVMKARYRILSDTFGKIKTSEFADKNTAKFTSFEQLRRSFVLAEGILGRNSMLAVFLGWQMWHSSHRSDRFLVKNLFSDKYKKFYALLKELISTYPVSNTPHIYMPALQN